MKKAKRLCINLEVLYRIFPYWKVEFSGEPRPTQRVRAKNWPAKLYAILNVFKPEAAAGKKLSQTWQSWTGVQVTYCWMSVANMNFISAIWKTSTFIRYCDSLLLQLILNILQLATQAAQDTKKGLLKQK